MTSSQPSTYQQGHNRAVTANHIVRTAEAEGAFLLPHLKPHFRILDVGCGPGSITSGFAKYVPQGSVTGVDLTSEVLGQAKEHLNNQDPKPDNVTFEVGNVVDGLHFQDETFDVVFCNQTLLHIPEPVKAMKEMRRVCKTGGVVACREADWPFRYYPELPGLQIFHKYLWLMIHGPPSPANWSSSSPSASAASTATPDEAFLIIAPHPPNHRSGSRIHVWAREAGFDPAKITKAASAQVYSTADEKKFLAGVMAGRIEQGGHRKKYLELGASEEEVDEIVKGWREWEKDVDGWFTGVNCEVLSWK
ncbi:hypothetical protein N0V83_006147 [Neocucurbitaria cava]|uniref:Methyltransferase domain-containing protein n=1 Tax=Neocucurbitaria cava TaxID=798079 RepID=A0A9W8Y7D3_9PLEO|nr:hypothetical protein N0V83_006147 [Neocucurbitaria cava]